MTSAREPARLPLDPHAKHRTVRGLTLSKRLCCVAPQAIFKAPPAPPGDTHELIERYWVEAGDLDRVDPEAEGRYVVTPGVKTHLAALARAALLRRHPILLQGPTSSGKTSLVEYLAERTGHRFMRINNHEHTDLQEYLGSYVTDEKGARRRSKRPRIGRAQVAAVVGSVAPRSKRRAIARRLRRDVFFWFSRAGTRSLLMRPNTVGVIELEGCRRRIFALWRFARPPATPE